MRGTQFSLFFMVLRECFLTVFLFFSLIFPFLFFNQFIILVLRMAKSNFLLHLEFAVFSFFIFLFIFLYILKIIFKLVVNLNGFN